METPKTLVTSTSTPSSTATTPKNESPQVLPVSNGYATINLDKDQIPHYYRACEIFLKSRFFLDISMPGTGKTYIAAAIAMTFGYKLLVIAPASLTAYWEEFCKKHFIPVHTIVSYSTLRSKPPTKQEDRCKWRELKNGLLFRYDGYQKSDIKFAASQKLRSILADKTLVVFEEASEVKNESQQTDAAICVVRTLYEVESCARMVFLSGSLFDNEKNTANVLKYLGIIKSDTLCRKEKGSIQLYGAQEAIDFCSAIDETATKEVLSRNAILNAKEDVEELIFQLFTRVLKKLFASEMPPLDLDKDLKDGYYKVADPNIEAKLREAIENLKGIVGWKDGKVDEAAAKQAHWSAGFKSAHIALSVLKAEGIIIPLVRKILATHPKAKIIVGSDYDEVTNLLDKAFADINILKLTGKETKKSDEKLGVIKTFNTDPRFRVLLANIQVLQMGYSLHDEVGDAPRFMFLIPNFSAIRMYQISYRIIRKGMKSRGFIRNVFASVGAEERSILDSLTKKGTVLQQISGEQTNEKVRYPGFYQRESQDEFEKVLIDLASLKV